MRPPTHLVERRGKRVWTLALAFALAAGLAIPAAGEATVTIGSNLANPPTGNVGGPITSASIVLPAASRAPGGVASPVNGTVTTWRVRRAGGFNNAVALRVIRPLGPKLFSGAGTAAAIVPPAGAITASTTQLPISIGDLIGVDDTGASGIGIYRTTDGAQRLSWYTPPLADGGGGRAPTQVSVNFSAEVTVNADVEPTSAFTIDRIKRKKKGKLRITVTVPNPGVLVAGDARDHAAAAATKKRRLQSRSASVAAPGQVVLVVPATKSAKRKLKLKARRKGKKKAKLKASLGISFAPTGGGSSVQTVPVRLKRVAERS